MFPHREYMSSHGFEVLSCEAFYIAHVLKVTSF
ncbi:hypothetical protein T07_1624 [Trichinella nelsoni]|uniref:Uncharacterized protein n=1 Tax=Trichinella nelsoni TaxID=6336 RepID=A0A0V0S2R0_9BILA|nr:hypothetical protein T07_1624 [Trichinella nelsoni]